MENGACGQTFNFLNKNEKNVVILVCVLIFFLFSIFRACCNHCFVLWRHSQFHLTVFSSVFLSCAVQFVQ